MSNDPHLTVYLTLDEIRQLAALAEARGLSRHAFLQRIVREGMEAHLRLVDAAQVVEEARMEYDRALRAEIERTMGKIAERRLKKLPPDKQFVALLGRETETREFVQGLAENVRQNVLRKFAKDRDLADRFRSYLGASKKP